MLMILRFYKLGLLVILSLIPEAMILYLSSFSLTQRFESHFGHEIAIIFAVGATGFITYVCYRSYCSSGEIFLRWITAGFLLFTIIYTPNGLLTSLAEHNALLFLLYGPASRVVMAVCLIIATYNLGRTAERPAELSQSGFWRKIWVCGLVVDLGVAALAVSPNSVASTARVSMEAGAATLAVVTLGLLANKRLLQSPLLILFAIAVACFAQASIAFLITTAWSHIWWSAHVISALGFFILSWAAAHSLQGNLSFAEALSGESMLGMLRANVNALKQSERFLRAITDHLPATVTYVDKDQIVRFANRTAASWNGRPVPEMEGRRIEEVLSPGAVDPAAITRALAGEITHSEAFTSYADGQARWVEATRVPYKDDDGIVRGYFRMAIDATARKTAEHAALQAQSILADAIESIKHDIVLYDGEDRLAVINKTAVDRFRVPGLADVLKVGVRYEDLIRTMVERGLYIIPAGQSKDELVASFVADHRHADGTEKVREMRDGIVRSVSSHRTQNGGIITIGIDVTNEARATRAITEARNNLSDAIESIDHGIILYDRDERLILANRVAASRIEQTANLFKVGARFEDLMRASVEGDLYVTPPEKSKEAYIAELVETHRRADGSIQIHHLHDGRILQSANYRARSGGVVRIGKDITKQFETERKLRESQKMDAIGQLTGGIAHDFNNQLSVIIGNIELAMARLPEDTQLVQHMERALTGANRSAELTRSLLAFARQQSLAPKICSINHCISEAVHLLDRTLGEDIEVVVHTDQRPWSVLVDEAQLVSCVLNLAINARDAMPEGGTLTVVVRNVDAGKDEGLRALDLPFGEYVSIEISDTGAGMTPETLAKVFEPFFTTKDFGKGTGLGLSMVHGFIHQSSGHIAIRSEVGQGTTVQIHLPRVEERRAASASGPGAPEPRPLGKATVLVVEDNEGVRQVVMTQLESLGYRVIEAADGPSALAVLDASDQDIDLLFTDVVMPGKMDGYALAGEAAKRRPGLKVLLTSGYPGKTSQGDGERRQRLLAKPYSLTTLAIAIAAVLEAHG